MSERIMKDNLTVLAQTYADATGLSLATVSKRIHGKGCFLVDFIAGRSSTTITTYFAMIDRLRETWPKGTKWPATRAIPRPLRNDVTDAHRAKRAKTMPKRTEDGRFVPKKKKGDDNAA